MLRSYTELSEDYARQRAGEGSRWLAWGAVSFCHAGMNRQQGSALPHCMMSSIVEDSLLRACVLLGKGSGRDSLWSTSLAMQGAQLLPLQVLKHTTSPFKLLAGAVRLQMLMSAESAVLGRPGMAGATAFYCAPV